ncbi:hypothetical protein BU25DRAFT_342232 [Macroventuria anomochaeta]|uniref:Uncharacterized protein n=1 Tax=Macroventuria anomochaeta TaxID=301207 RepID=A0ACB6RZE0_9PLEO|nr:uncharacterized protein BU25DRAFT_342232 [Macroventuria anomochaeta]KAF2627139.1 hypothetical protein BU25DRAFT_342232 [Macroventuria anomochaeta]
MSGAVNYLNTLTLDVGGRKFKVSTDVLTSESGLFRHQLDGRFAWTPEPDGSYFLDADPELFEYLLAFMRRPEVFPLFYTKTDGFNYNLYNRLAVEAKYFQIDALHDWIKDKRYLSAISVHTHSSVTHDLATIGITGFMSAIDEERHVVSCVKKVYLCPRQIVVHRGRPEQCGHACRKKQAENPVMYDEEPCVHLVRVKKDIIFDEKVCQLT